VARKKKDEPLKGPPRRCDGCGAIKASRKGKGGGWQIPGGWKLWRGKELCHECLEQRFTLRAVEIEVEEALAVQTRERGEWLPLTWRELAGHLHRAWTLGTDLGCWAVQQLMRREPPVLYGKALPPLPGKNGDLYRDFQQHPDRALWERATPSAAAILLQAERHYRRWRAATQGRRNQDVSASGRKYPWPFPVPAQDCVLGVTEPAGGHRILLQVPARLKEKVEKKGMGINAALVEQEADVAAATRCGQCCIELPLTGGARVRLLLRASGDFRRQLGDLQLLLRGEAIGGEVQILAKRAKSGLGRRPEGCPRQVLEEARQRGRKNRKQLVVKEPGGGNLKYLRLFVKVAGRFPRQALAEKGQRCLLVQTEEHAFLSTELFDGSTNLWLKTLKDAEDVQMVEQKRNPHIERWVLNADQLSWMCRDIERYNRNVQRLNQDRKAESRHNRQKRRRLAEISEKRADKHRAVVLDRHVRSTVNSLLGYCRRYRVGSIVLALGAKRFPEKFPWYVLGRELEAAARNNHLTFCKLEAPDDSRKEGE
jgi:hypothetical protein